MTSGATLLDRALAESIERFVRPRRNSDPAYVHHGLRWLHAPSGALATDSPGARDWLTIARALATVAWADMSLAFSLWCHRMVIEYMRTAQDGTKGSGDGGGGDVGRWLAPLERAEVLGSSGLAAAMAHYVGGAPLPVKAAAATERRFELTGKLRWASNLFPGGFLLVTAADAGAAGKVIVLVPAGREGLAVEPYPELLDLQSTASSSIELSATPVDAKEIVSTDFNGFIGRVRPVFLLMQSSFCWGLAARSLFEATALVARATNEVFVLELHALEAERNRVEVEIASALSGAPVAPEDARPIVSLRLRAAQLAGAATRLECKLAGGAGYAARSSTARRLREAAFLPIQSPTEGQLLWELSRSA